MSAMQWEKAVQFATIQSLALSQRRELWVYVCVEELSSSSTLEQRRGRGRWAGCLPGPWLQGPTECSDLTEVTFGKCNTNNHNLLLITVPAGTHQLDLSIKYIAVRPCSVELLNYYRIRSDLGCKQGWKMLWCQRTNGRMRCKRTCITARTRYKFHLI